MHTSRVALLGLALLLLGAVVTNACRLEPSRLRGDLTISDMALHFNGQGQVTLQSTSFGGSGFTIMVEVFLESNDGTIFSAGSPGTNNFLELRIEQRAIVLQVGNEEARTFAVTQQGEWQKLVVTVDNKRGATGHDVKFYLDNMNRQENAGGEISTGIPVANRAARLGKSAGSGAAFRGYMDNFVIINSVVTLEDVNWFSAQYIPFISSDNLVMYFPFNDVLQNDKVTAGHGGSSINDFVRAEYRVSGTNGLVGPTPVVKAEVSADEVVDKFCDHQGVTFQDRGSNDYENLPPFFNTASGGHTITVQCENEDQTDSEFVVMVRWIPDGGIDQMTIKTSKQHYWRVSAGGLVVEHRTWGGWNTIPRGADLIKGDNDYITYKFTDEAVTFQAGKYGYIKITENQGLLSYQYAVNTFTCPHTPDFDDSCSHREVTQAEYDFSESPVPEMPLGAPSEQPGVGGRPPVLACPSPSPQYRPQVWRRNYYNQHGVWPDQPCVLGQWSSYSGCSKNCGGGYQTRTRPVRIQPGPQGTPCGSTTETRVCNDHPCPVHCVVSAWTAWSGCSEPCDDGTGSQGTKTRSRRVTVSPKYGGNACPTLSGTAPCNRHLCPVDCEVSEWSTYGPCTVECDGGFMERTRTVTTEQVGAGAECPPLTDTDPCNTHPCPVDCEVSTWNEWSSCTTTCGGGSRTRERTVTVEPCCLGAPCPELVEFDRCNEDPCPITMDEYDPCADTKRREDTLYDDIVRACDNSFTSGSSAHNKCLRDSCITGTPSTTKPDCLAERLKKATVVGYEIDPKCEVTPCPNECSGNGQCVDGVCQCDDGFTGKDCLVETAYGCFKASAPGSVIPVDPVHIDKGSEPMPTAEFDEAIPAALRKTMVVDSVVFSIAETADASGKDHHIMIMNNNGDGLSSGGESSYTLTITGLDTLSPANFVTFAERGAGVTAPVNNAGVWSIEFTWPATGRCGLAIKGVPSNFNGEFQISNKQNAVLQVLVASAYGVDKASPLLAVHKYTEDTITLSGGVCQNDCEAIRDCGDCAAQAACGWCVESDRCMPGDASGPHYYGSCANWRYSFETDVNRRLTQEYAAPVSPGYTDVYIASAAAPGDDLPLEVSVDINAPEKIQWDLVVLAEWGADHKRTWQNNLVTFLKTLTGFPNIGVALNKHSTNAAGYEKIKKLSNPRDFHYIGIHVNNAATHDSASIHNIAAAIKSMSTTDSNPVGWRQGARRVLMITSDKPYPFGTAYTDTDVAEMAKALLGRDIIPAFVVSREHHADYQLLVEKLGFGFVTDLTSKSGNFVDATVRSLRLASGHAATFYDEANAGHLDRDTWTAHKGSFTMFGLTDDFQARFPIPVHSRSSDISVEKTILHMPAFGSATIENVLSDKPTAFAVPERSSGTENTGEDQSHIQIIELKGMSWKNLLKVVPRIETPPNNGVLFQVKTVDGEPVAADIVDYTQGIIDDPLGRVAYAPNLEVSGKAVDTFTFVMTDGCDVSEIVTVTIDVSSVNKPPRAEIVPPTEDEDTANIIVLSGFDEDNDWKAVITDGLHEMNAQGVRLDSSNIGVLYAYDDQIINSRADAEAVGVPIEAGYEVTTQSDGLKKLVYWPALHTNSHADFEKTPDLLVKPCFNYKVVEVDTPDEFESDVARVPVDIRPVNDAPFVYNDADPEYIYEWKPVDPTLCWDECTFEEDFGEKYPWDAGFEYLSLGGGDIELSLLTFRLTDIDCPTEALIQTDLITERNLVVGDELKMNEPGVLHPLIRFRPGADQNNDFGGRGDYYCKIEYEIVDEQGAVSAKKHTITINVTPVNDHPRLRGGDNTYTVIEQTTEVFELSAEDPEGRGYSIIIKECKNAKGTFRACSEDINCETYQEIDCDNIPAGGLELTARTDSESAYRVSFTSDELRSLSEGLNYQYLVVSFTDGTVGQDDEFYVNFNVIMINEPPTITVDGVNEDVVSREISTGAYFAPKLVANDVDLENGEMMVTIEVTGEDDGSFIEFAQSHDGAFLEQTERMARFVGRLDVVNDILASFKFQPAKDFHDYTLVVEVNDQGFTGLCRPVEGQAIQWSNNVCELTDTVEIKVRSVDQALIDSAIVAGAGVGVLGLAVIGAVAATRFFNRAGADPAYAPWEDFEGDGSSVANPLYEAAGVEGSNALYQGAADYQAMGGDNNSYL